MKDWNDGILENWNDGFEKRLNKFFLN